VGTTTRCVLHLLTTTHEAFDRWLLLKDHSALDYVLAVAVANRFEADPLWAFIVSPSGGTKTELIISLGQLPETKVMVPSGSCLMHVPELAGCSRTIEVHLGCFWRMAT
jgi:hypothetical protein